MTDAEEKILQATVDCIEEYGINGTTIRRIGNKAGMNSAAINYYFRSKGILMDRVLQATLDNAFNWDDFKYTEALPLHEQLDEIFIFLAVKPIQFRNITQAHLYEIVQHANYQTELTTKLNGFLEKVFGEVRRKKPELPDEEIRLALTQLAAATLPFFSTFSNLYNSFSGLDMSKEENRIRYVKRLVEKLI